MTKAIALLSQAVVCLCFINNGTGQEIDVGDSHYRAISRYIDSGTVAIIRLDLLRYNSQTAMNILRDVERENQNDAEEFRQVEQEAVAWQFRMLNYGCRELYVVISLADVPKRSPFIIAKVDQIHDHSELLRGLENSSFVREFLRISPTSPSWEQMHGDIVVGDSATLTRLKESKPNQNDSWTEAFKTASPAAMQVFIVPKLDAITEQINWIPALPDDPETRTENSGLLREVRCMSLSVGLSPDLSMTTEIVAHNAESAVKVGTILNKIATTVSKFSDKSLPEPRYEIVGLATKVKGNRVTRSNSSDPRDVSVLRYLYVQQAGDAIHVGRQLRNRENLSEIARAISNYHDVYRKFPPVGSRKSGEERFLSWRVYVLPFLGEVQLFNQFRFDEPWDSPHNQKLLNKMPDVYRHPRLYLKERSRTVYQVPLGGRTVLSATEDRNYGFINEHAANNHLMVVEASSDRAVPWTKPADLEIDMTMPFSSMGDHWPHNPDNELKNGYVGAVRFNARFQSIPRDQSNESLLKVLTLPNR